MTPTMAKDDPPPSHSSIRFRLTQLDTLNVSPTESSPLGLRTSPFLPRGQQLYKVPVVRIFGATPAGQRVVAHIHGVMPYFYVQYEGTLDPDAVHKYIRRLGASLNYATAASLGRIKTNKPIDRGKHQYVAYIALCKGIPFYGFHVGYRYFLKIYCLHSRFKSRMAELLRTGKVMNPYFQTESLGANARRVQPSELKIFEEHIPFHLQFMLDHNLYGCGWVELADCQFRRPLPDEHISSSTEGPVYLASNVPEFRLGPVDLSKSSYCPLELDCHASSIINRHDVKERRLHHDFVELFQDPILNDEKLVQSVKELWEDERKRRRERGQAGPEEVHETGPTSQRDYGTGEQPRWFMEPQLRAQIEELIQKQQPKVIDPTKHGPTDSDTTLKNFIKPESKLSQLIPTAFQAVEAIYVSKWLNDELEDNPYGVWAINGIGIGLSNKVDNDLALKETDATFCEETEEPLGIDIAAIQSQMETYNDEGQDEENDLVGDAVLGAIEEEEEEFDELNWDEIDLQDGTVQREMRPGGSKNVTPTKGHSIDSLTLSNSPSVSPSKRSPINHKASRSPCKLDVNQSSLQSFRENIIQGSLLELRDAGALIPPGTLKRERLAEDDGFYQPKVGKMMRFVERLQQEVTDPDSDLPNKVASLRGDITTPMKSNSLLEQSSPDSLSLQQPMASASAISDASFMSQSSHVDEQAKMKLDFAILTQTQRPKRHWQEARWFRHCAPCPTTGELMKSLTEFDLPMKVYRDPFYSDLNDVPDRKREYAGRQYTLLGNSLRFIREFNHAVKGFGPVAPLSQKSIPNVLRWEFATLPPTLSDLKKSVSTNKTKSGQNFLLVSQVEGPTQHSGGFKFTPVKSKSTMQGSQLMDVLAVEVHADSQNDRRPDPAVDQIKVLFYCYKTEREDVPLTRPELGTQTGLIMVDERSEESRTATQSLKIPKYALDHCCIELVDTEIELLNSLIDKVRLWDPEVLTGFELESWSWGYVMRRGRELDFDLIYEFSRTKSESQGRFAGKDDKWGYTHGSSIKITGRHVLSIWRIIRSELALNQYTFENVVNHVLRTRVPHYSFSTLAKWWQKGTFEQRRRVLMYYIVRVEFEIKLVDETEMISRNAEIARTLGVDFFSAISRGSQFKVESVLFRIAKPENYLLPSPSRAEVAKQNAAECIPLVMEPKSAYYKSPLLVLDFQSLYPSIMIAYNYCYSTCLGRVNYFKGINKLGTSIIDLPPGFLKSMKDRLIVSPNGLMFVKPSVRKSLLSKMLGEFLDTRVMIKQSMKFIKDDRALTKMLNARQLGLKFIANVTYGYTSASFSGRMPCVEVADAIVQTGRETLEKAMDLIHSVKEWDAKVVYGDTDSLFVYLPGRTKEEAFRIGNEMAEAVTKKNPIPVKLKFEKVYLPCVLMAKKRYVGAKYEQLSDLTPVFDAKGIEVVRRDGIPALQKIQETCLKKLFETQDLSDIKAYLYRQWQRLLLGKVSIQDFTFAKEVKLGTYSEKGPPPPGALIAARKMALDPRTEPAYAERVPYVIVKGAPQSRLRDRAVSPEILLQNRLLALDAEYYINRVFVPSLDRIFNLVGVNVAAWYQSMPKMMRVTKANTRSGLIEPHSIQLNPRVSETGLLERNDRENPNSIVHPSNKLNHKLLVDEHFRSDRCLNCEEDGQQGILCQECASNPNQVSLALLTKARLNEKKRRDIESICRRCSSISTTEPKIECDSLDCGILYDRMKSNWMVDDSRRLIEAVDLIDQGQNLSLQMGTGPSSLEW